jgi:hypothetical protein
MSINEDDINPLQDIFGNAIATSLSFGSIQRNYSAIACPLSNDNRRYGRRFVVEWVLSLFV